MHDQLLYQIALTMIDGVGDILGRQLLQAVGDVKAIFTEKSHVLTKVPGIGTSLAARIKQPEVLRRAEKELAFIEKKKITTYFLPDENYPRRLRECPDAPLLLYFRGNADLNAKHSISVVGTRRVTEYGMYLSEKFISELAKVFPDLLIVSGLAYGVDILSHRNALKAKLPTVGILAHGLNRIYPSIHRDTAIEMLEQGGLATEFPSEASLEKSNFVQRNRIIAGLTEATIVVESPEKGGSLITADLAVSYSRDVYAFPGRVTDTNSQGCNRIINQTKAGLISSAADFISAICWDTSIIAKSQPEQTAIAFPENENSIRVLQLIHEKKEVHINQLSIETQLPVQQVFDILFDLEMDGHIKSVPGNTYKIL